jgi:hypothetical protein
MKWQDSFAENNNIKFIPHTNHQEKLPTHQKHEYKCLSKINT